MGSSAHRAHRAHRALAPAFLERHFATAGPQRVTTTPKQPRWHLRHRPQGIAEAGLGTTVFGILGLVTLPIALLGLLLSGGGLVWGIVAGAAALAILVAYLDPFG